MKLFGAIWISLLCCNCSTNVGTGVIAGSTVGAGAGALIGGGGGALIGTAVGLVGMGLIGAKIDEQDRKVIEQSSPRTMDRIDRGEPLTINDVIRLSQNGVSDETIITYIYETHTIYNLSQTQIRRLQEAGVSKPVVHFMINSKM